MHLIIGLLADLAIVRRIPPSKLDDPNGLNSTVVYELFAKHNIRLEQRWKEEGFISDLRGHPYHFLLKPVVYSGKDRTYECTMWNDGFNGRNEQGHGDDMVRVDVLKVVDLSE